MTQRPVQWRVLDLSDTFEPSDDWSWSLLAIDQCGRVLQHVFGPDPGDLQRFNALKDEVLWWQRKRPKTFDALLVGKEEDDSRFPILPLQADCHGISNDFRISVYILTLIVMGWQYNLLAHILLTVRQPLPNIEESRNHDLLLIDVSLSPRRNRSV